MRAGPWASTGLWVAVLLLSNGVRAQQTPSPISGRSLNGADILPADVLARASLLRAEVDLIRARMNKPRVAPLLIGVAHAQPREVYFQALAVFHKANELSFDQVRRLGAVPSTVPTADIRPYHVWTVVNEAFKRILEVKKDLGITKVAKEVRVPDETTPSEVFGAVLQADRQLHSLLDQQYGPAEVFQQVTLAVHYSARLLAHFAAAKRIPEAPAFEPDKLPADVFRRLQSCLDVIRRIAARSGEKMLEPNTDKVDWNAVVPGDVYYMASLVVSELAHLHGQAEDISAVVPAYHPGDKTPSHVFRRAGLLETQLEQLLMLMGSEPSGPMVRQ